MAGEFFIAHNTKTDEYLAEKRFRGFYMTPDVTSALKCKDEMELKKKIEKANGDHRAFTDNGSHDDYRKYTCK